MSESISHARKRPVPVVLLPDQETEWVFDLGDGLEVWPWSEPPDVLLLCRTRTPKVKARSRNVPVYAYSTTTRSHLRLESGLEHDLVRELDRRSDVTWLVPQPCRLRLPARRAGRRLEHVPDLLSQHSDGSVCLWDARASDGQDGDFLLKVRLAAEACGQVGWRHEAFIELAPTRRTNLMWISGFRRQMPWHAAAWQFLVEAMPAEVTVGDVLALDAGGGHVISTMWHAIWAGQLECDLDRPITRATPLHLRADAPGSL